MTAEVLIMNKIAVALAADSAVTISDEKTYNSANKLFALSKHQPVGVMVFGNGQLMGIPWESIIKIYRKELGIKRFNTLEEYCITFINYLDNNKSLFSESEQELYFYDGLLGYFNSIKKEIDKETQEIIKKESRIVDDKVKDIFFSKVKEKYERLQKFPKLPYVPDNHSVEVINQYRSQIKKAIDGVFEKLPRPEGIEEHLEKIGGELFSREIFKKKGYSGVVIAGFGESEIFPSSICYKIDGVTLNRLKYKKQNTSKITFDMGAVIIPLAQREAVDTFIQGMDPNHHSVMQAYLSRMLEKYPERIVDNISNMKDEEKKALIVKLKKIYNSLFTEFNDQMVQYQMENHIGPIMDAVAALPIDELATMAETLVNLTSFKRRISMDKETVGGPIDVAVISKGDGFIWIKRKLYFKPELNHHFFKNYYNDEKNKKEKYDGTREEQKDRV